MTTTTLDERPLERIRWTFADAWTMALRTIQHWRNRPGIVIFNWLFPVLMMAMFVGLMGGALGLSTDGRYIDFVMPGILAMAMFFGLEGTMTAVSTDASKGVTDRFRSLPMSGSAVVAGRCIADLMDSVIALIIIAAAGMAFGWRPEASAPEFLAAFALLILLRFAMLWIGVFIGLKVSNPEALSAVQVMVWPLLFLSSVFVNTTTMPGWLGALAEANPLSATATAARDVLGSPGLGGGSWFAENATVLAVVCPVVIVAVFVPLSVLTYRHLRR